MIYKAPTMASWTALETSVAYIKISGTLGQPITPLDVEVIGVKLKKVDGR